MQSVNTILPREGRLKPYLLPKVARVLLGLWGVCSLAVMELSQLILLKNNQSNLFFDPESHHLSNSVILDGLYEDICTKTGGHLFVLFC